MGVSVADLERLRKGVRCPEEDPPDSRLAKLIKDLDGDETSIVIDASDDDQLEADAGVDFDTFDTTARAVLGDWYTDLRLVVVVGPKTYNEREELRQRYLADIT